jgi:hypothetical protein
LVDVAHLFRDETFGLCGVRRGGAEIAEKNLRSEDLSYIKAEAMRRR